MVAYLDSMRGRRFNYSLLHLVRFIVVDDNADCRAQARLLGSLIYTCNGEAGMFGCEQTNGLWTVRDTSNCSGNALKFTNDMLLEFAGPTAKRGTLECNVGGFLKDKNDSCEATVKTLNAALNSFSDGPFAACENNASTPTSTRTTSVTSSGTTTPRNGRISCAEHSGQSFLVIPDGESCEADALLAEQLTEECAKAAGADPAALGDGISCTVALGGETALIDALAQGGDECPTAVWLNNVIEVYSRGSVHGRLVCSLGGYLKDINGNCNTTAAILNSALGSFTDGTFASCALSTPTTSLSSTVSSTGSQTITTTATTSKTTYTTMTSTVTTTTSITTSPSTSSSTTPTTTVSITQTFTVTTSATSTVTETPSWTPTTSATTSTTRTSSATTSVSRTATTSPSTTGTTSSTKTSTATTTASTSTSITTSLTTSLTTQTTPTTTATSSTSLTSTVTTTTTVTTTPIAIDHADELRSSDSIGITFLGSSLTADDWFQQIIKITLREMICLYGIDDQIGPLIVQYSDCISSLKIIITGVATVPKVGLRLTKRSFDTLVIFYAAWSVIVPAAALRRVLDGVTILNAASSAPGGFFSTFRPLEPILLQSFEAGASDPIIPATTTTAAAVAATTTRTTTITALVASSTFAALTTVTSNSFLTNAGEEISSNDAYDTSSPAFIIGVVAACLLILLITVLITRYMSRQDNQRNQRAERNEISFTDSHETSGSVNSMIQMRRLLDHQLYQALGQRGSETYFNNGGKRSVEPTPLNWLAFARIVCCAVLCVILSLIYLTIEVQMAITLFSILLLL